MLGLIDLNVVDTGPLPPSGGNITRSLASIDTDLPLGLGFAVADALRAHTEGGGTLASSFARLANLDFGLEVDPVVFLTISGDLVRADSSARCAGTVPSVSGSSIVTDLVVLGVPIVVTGEPNQTVSVLGLADVVINEQIVTGSGRTRAITVNAVHVTVPNPVVLPPPLPPLPDLAEVIVSSAHSDITCFP